MNIKRSLPIVCALTLFGIGGSLLISGITLGMPVLLYSSGGFSAAAVAFTCYICARDKPRQLVFETPTFPPRLYNDPGMKKSKSDSNLELMSSPKNTVDDGSLPSIV
jgi:hypothetical protein